MAELTITLDGWEEIAAAIGRITAIEAMRPAMQHAVELVQEKLAIYPDPPEAGSFPGFASAKQRRWFFWALRQGLIQVPYRRTGVLGKSWTTSIETSENGMTGIVGTNTIYAPWVQGPTFPNTTEDGKYQARIHQGRWQTAHGVLEENADAIMAEFAEQLERVWDEEYLGGGVSG